MENSSLKVYSVYNNIVRTIKTGKLDTDIYKEVWINIWLKQRENRYWRENCQRIFNDLENNYYDYTDFCIAVYYLHMFQKSVPLYLLNQKSIHEIRDLFHTDQVKKDKDLILKIKERGNLEKVNFFELLEDGQPIIYHLIKDKTVSPFIFVKAWNNKSIQKLLTGNDENVIFNTDYKRFIVIIKLLTTHFFNGG